MANENVPDAKKWVTGEVITADALNQLEQNAHNAYALADTNEKDIDSIDHIVQGIATDASGEVALRAGIVATDAIADGSVTADKLGSDVPMGTEVNTVSPATGVAADHGSNAGSLAVGSGAIANGGSATAIGDTASAAIASTALGAGATADSKVDVYGTLEPNGKVAVGKSAACEGGSLIAIGENAYAGRDKSIAIGSNAMSFTPKNVDACNIAIGTGANACRSNSGVAIGYNARGGGNSRWSVDQLEVPADTVGAGCVALGAWSSGGSFSVGGSPEHDNDVVSVGRDSRYENVATEMVRVTDSNGSPSASAPYWKVVERSIPSSFLNKKRRIVNVGDPKNDTDAATKAYVDNIFNSFAIFPETQTPTIPSITQLTDVSMSPIPAWSNGSLRNGLMTITNGDTAKSLPAGTAFATDLNLAPNKSYSVCSLGGEENAIQVNSTGKSLSFAVDFMLPDGATVVLAILEEDFDVSASLDVAMIAEEDRAFAVDSAPEIVDMTITCVDCECDNFIGGVEKNHQYKGTFKPNEGYALAEVVVVLGGEDVTERYYDNASCTVKVPRVNEFLQIKAVANPVRKETAGQE